METKALICAAQEQALRTNHVKFNIDKNGESPLCRMCGKKGGSVGPIMSECSILAQKEYKRRHNGIPVENINLGEQKNGMNINLKE